MARRPPERPTFEPHEQPGSPSAGPPPLPPRPGRDPLRAMAPFFATLTAIGVTALAIWLPVREAQHESLKHYESTQYLDVKPGTTFTWHDVQWQMKSMRQIPWKYYNGASPPPKRFVRFRIVLHARMLGQKTKLRAEDVDENLHGGFTGQTFDYELRDRDERSWDPMSIGTDVLRWPSYKPANGMDLTIYADAPAGKAGEVMLTAKFEDNENDFNLTKTPGPRKTMLRFLR